MFKWFINDFKKSDLEDKLFSIIFLFFPLINISLSLLNKVAHPQVWTFGIWSLILYAVWFPLLRFRYIEDIKCKNHAHSIVKKMLDLFHSKNIYDQTGDVKLGVKEDMIEQVIEYRLFYQKENAPLMTFFIDKSTNFFTYEKISDKLSLIENQQELVKLVKSTLLNLSLSHSPMNNERIDSTDEVEKVIFSLYEKLHLLLKEQVTDVTIKHKINEQIAYDLERITSVYRSLSEISKEKNKEKTMNLLDTIDQQIKHLFDLLEENKGKKLDVLLNIIQTRYQNKSLL